MGDKTQLETRDKIAQSSILCVIPGVLNHANYIFFLIQSNLYSAVTHGTDLYKDGWLLFEVQLNAKITHWIN